MDLRITQLAFDIIKEIGQEGRNSKTYLAQDVQFNGTVVVKSIHKPDIPQGTPYFSEARHLYSSKHPNVMEIHYASQDDDYVYLAMPFYKNGSLNSIIQHRYLTVREIVKYALDFLSALHYIHTKKLIHFDVKPTNIIINDSGSAILTDFGLTKLTNQYGFATADLVYPTHLPPEIFTTYAHTSQYDIYQAGLTLYRMCNGNRDFDEKLTSGGVTRDEVINGLFPDRNKYLPHIPRSLRSVIENALKTDLMERYQAILHMMNDLSSVCENLDWKYDFDTTTGIQTWVEETDKSVRTLKLFEQNGEWITEGEKLTKASGNTTRIRDWNSTNNSQEEAYNKIETMLLQ